jgi:hypothetical protein
MKRRQPPSFLGNTIGMQGDEDFCPPCPLKQWEEICEGNAFRPKRIQKEKRWRVADPSQNIGQGSRKRGTIVVFDNVVGIGRGGVHELPIALTIRLHIEALQGE